MKEQHKLFSSDYYKEYYRIQKKYLFIFFQQPTEEKFDRDCQAELVKIIVFTKHTLNSVNVVVIVVTESKEHRFSVRLQG